jgi:putative two-component system response regulator
MMAKILVVDDQEAIRHLLGQIMTMGGYTYALAANAKEARTCLKNQDFDLILCDNQMPGESGISLVQYIRTDYPDTAVIMLTGLDDPEIVKTAREIGTYGYMVKPFKPNELLINITNALHRRELEIANRAYRKNLEGIVRERTAELQDTSKKLRKTMMGIIQAMTLTVEARDPYTAGHQRRVANLARYIATDMGLSEDQVDGIRTAGVLHDLGKISVPVEILAKPIRLTEIEYKMIQTHPQVAFDILKEIEFPWPIVQIVYQHHERMDGSGYPLGISDEDILLEARIIAVADTVEAMSSHRPYRPSLGIEEALKEISQKRGAIYDPNVVDACLRLFRKKEFKF